MRDPSSIEPKIRKSFGMGAKDQTRNLNGVGSEFCTIVITNRIKKRVQRIVFGLSRKDFTNGPFTPLGGR